MTHDPAERAAKVHALEEFHGGEVPANVVDRVILIDDALVHPFVD